MWKVFVLLLIGHRTVVHRRHQDDGRVGALLCNPRRIELLSRKTIRYMWPFIWVAHTRRVHITPLLFILLHLRHFYFVMWPINHADACTK